MKTKLVNENFETDYVRQLLRERGVEDIERYLRPTTDCLLEPSLLKNIGVGAALYRRIVKNNGRILVVVDADVDGTCSASIIYQYTQRLNPSCRIDFILHEHKQHGLSDLIERIVDCDVRYDLIICPDSSTNDKEFHDRLDELGTPCLVVDHHLLDNEISDNAVIINNQTSPNYPNKDLVGAGVSWQFCRYVDSLEGTNYAWDYIDLAALGQVGDMGSLLPLENRFIVSEGLKAANIKNGFFKALLEKQAYSITGKMNSSWNEIVAATNATSIAFYIVPLINALVRVGTMAEKELLLRAFTDGNALVPSGKRGEKGTMTTAAIEAVRVCGNARTKQNKIRDTAVERLEYKIFKYDLLENEVLFIELDDEDSFPAELNGLIANQLCSKYKKPTIVARRDDFGEIKGSARAPGQTELTDFRQFLADSNLFTFAQGQEMALNTFSAISGVALCG